MNHQVRDLGITSSFNSSSMKQKSEDSMKTSSFTVENLPWKPSCHCGDAATLRRSSTSKSYGKYFWGCSHFKICLYFRGCSHSISIVHFQLSFVKCREQGNPGVGFLNGFMRMFKMTRVKL